MAESTTQADASIGLRETALGRYRSLLNWHTCAKTRNRVLFFSFQALVVVLSGMTPILLIATDSKLWQALPSATAGILASMVSLFQFNESWIRWARSTEALKREFVLFEARCGQDYEEDISLVEATRHFVVRIEEINADARLQWAQQRARSEPPEKFLPKERSPGK